MKLIKTAILALATVTFSHVSMAQDANTILKKVDEIMYAPKDQQLNLKIILIDKNGKEKEREALILRKGMDKALFRFTAPESQAGIATLSLPDKIMYLYLPAFGKERRINSSAKGQKFAGTDFTYEDMEQERMAEKFNATIIEETADYWKLELLPKEGIRTGYSKLLLTVDKSNYYSQKIELFDKKSGRKIKELINIKTEQIDGYWIATEAVMKNLKTKHQTKMIMSNIKFDSGISDEEFTVRKLKQ